jgi:hypothetical protein
MASALRMHRGWATFLALQITLAGSAANAQEGGNGEALPEDAVLKAPLPAPSGVAVPAVQAAQAVQATPELATLGPRELSFRQPIPFGYRPVTRTNVLMIGIGVGAFALAYKSTVSSVAESFVRCGFEGAKAQLPVVIPVVGPLLVANPRPLELILGGVQALGLIVGIAGFFFPRTVLLRNDYRAHLRTLQPSVTRNTLGVIGQF